MELTVVDLILKLYWDGIDALCIGKFCTTSYDSTVYVVFDCIEKFEKLWNYKNVSLASSVSHFLLVLGCSRRQKQDLCHSIWGSPLGKPFCKWFACIRNVCLASLIEALATSPLVFLPDRLFSLIIENRRHLRGTVWKVDGLKTVQTGLFISSKFSEWSFSIDLLVVLVPEKTCWLQDIKSRALPNVVSFIEKAQIRSV